MLPHEPWMDYLVIGPEGWEGIRADAPQWAKEAWEKHQESIDTTKDGAIVEA